MAVNKQLTDYLSNGLRQGYDINALRDQLLKSGWPSNDVEESIAAVSGQAAGNQPTTSQTQHPQSLGLFARFKLSLFHPYDLFNAVKGEDGMGEYMKFFLVFSILISLVGGFVIYIQLQAILSLFMNLGGASSQDLTISPLSIISMWAMSYVEGIIGFLIGGGIFHLIVKIFGGNGDINQTFKAIAYGTVSPAFISSVPATIILLVPALGFVSLGAEMTLYLTAAIVIMIPFSIWGFYLAIVGLSVLHGISKMRALMIMLAPVLIIIAISLSSSLLASTTLSGYMNTAGETSLEVTDSFCVGGDTSNIVVSNGGTSAINTADVTVIDMETGSEVTGSWRGIGGSQIASISPGDVGIWEGSCDQSECSYRIVSGSAAAQIARITC